MADEGEKKRMSIREITEEVGRLYEAMKGMVDEATKEGEPLSQEKEEQYNRMNSRLTDLIKLRDQHYRLLEAQTAAQRNVERSIDREGEVRALSNADAPRGDRLQKFIASDEYRSAFSRYLRLGMKDLTPAEQRAMTEGTAADGGYLPAKEFLSTLIEKRFLSNAMRAVANIIPLGTFETEITIENAYPTAGYVAEGIAIGAAGQTPTAPGETSPTFSNLILKPKTMRVFTKVSNELLADAGTRGPNFNVEAILARQYGKVMGEKEENAFVVGTGTGMPKGCFAYTGGSEVGAITTAAGNTTTFTIQNLLDVVTTLKRQYRANAKWVMTDAVFSKIRSLLMVQSANTAATSNRTDAYAPFAWSLGDGRLQDGEPDRLFGFPVVCVAQGNAVSAGNVVAAFGDFSYYHIGEREGVSIKVAREAYLETNQTGVFAFARHDAAMSVYEAFKYLKMAAS
jgi:HK97 family phage major capsid protein